MDKEHIRVVQGRQGGAAWRVASTFELCPCEAVWCPAALLIDSHGLLGRLAARAASNAKAGVIDLLASGLNFNPNPAAARQFGRLR